LDESEHLLIFHHLSETTNSFFRWIRTSKLANLIQRTCVFSALYPSFFNVSVRDDVGAGDPVKNSRENCFKCGKVSDANSIHQIIFIIMPSVEKSGVNPIIEMWD
jgi:hypothetical protein